MNYKKRFLSIIMEVITISVQVCVQSFLFTYEMTSRPSNLDKKNRWNRNNSLEQK